MYTNIDYASMAGSPENFARDIYGIVRIYTLDAIVYQDQTCQVLGNLGNTGCKVRGMPPIECAHEIWQSQ